VDLNESKAAVRCIALGDSREPPVATFFGRMERWNEYRELVWMRTKAAPLQALGTNTLRQLAYRFEDEKFLADLIDVQPQLHKDRKKRARQESAKVGEKLECES
jgi:hypothetical protein